jgi:TonB family protein
MMYLGLVIKRLNPYKHGLALSFTLHGIALTGTLIYSTHHVNSDLKQLPLVIEMIFLKEKESLMKNFTGSFNHTAPIAHSTLGTIYSNKKAHITKQRVVNKIDSQSLSFTIARKEITMDVNGDYAKTNIHPSKPRRYSPVGFQSNNPKPQYPKRARELGFEGLVVLYVKVSKIGKVKNIKILSSSGHTLLDKAALNALYQWSFIPAKIGYQITEGSITIRIRFSLTEPVLSKVTIS